MKTLFIQTICVSFQRLSMDSTQIGFEKCSPALLTLDSSSAGSHLICLSSASGISILSLLWQQECYQNSTQWCVSWANKTYRNSLTHLGHFVRHHFLQGSMPYISSELQIADLLTKSHTTVRFRYLVSKLQMLSFEASWVWGGGVKHMDSVSSVYSK